MKNHNLLKGRLLALALIGSVYGAPAFAGKDVIYPSATTATVNVTSVAVTNNFTMGADGHTTLDSSANAGDMIVVTAKWSIQDKRGTGTNTDYTDARTVNFTVSSPLINPAPVLATLTGTACTGITSAGADKCETVISFVAPTTVGNYQVQVEAKDSVTGLGSNAAVNGSTYSINFSVTEQTEPTKKETKLTVDPKCVLLNSDVDLTATLEELDGGAKIGNANLYFSIDDSPIGSVTTNSSGVATRSFNVTGLGVGDYTLLAEFAGDR